MPSTRSWRPQMAGGSRRRTGVRPGSSKPRDQETTRDQEIKRKTGAHEIKRKICTDLLISSQKPLELPPPARFSDDHVLRTDRACRTDQPPLKLRRSAEARAKAEALGSRERRRAADKGVVNMSVRTVLAA